MLRCLNSLVALQIFKFLVFIFDLGINNLEMVMLYFNASLLQCNYTNTYWLILINNSLGLGFDLVLVTCNCVWLLLLLHVL